MEHKKSKKGIVVTAIILLFVLIIIGFIIVVTSTSNKKIFLNYLTQMSSSENGFFENSLAQYLEDKNTMPYSNEGMYSVQTPIEQQKSVNNFNISFSGQVDLANSKIFQDISLNYSEESNVKFKYKNIDNIAGIQADFLTPNYITVDKNNLEKIFQSTNINIKQILEIISYVQNSGILTIDERNQVLGTCSNILKEDLDNDDFSKVENLETEGYKLKLSGDEIKTILAEILGIIKNNSDILNKVNSIITIIDENNDIDKIINYINNLSLEKDIIEITLLTKNDVVTQINFDYSKENDKNSISLQKNSDENNLQYNIIYETSSTSSLIKQIQLSSTYNNISSENVSEVLELKYTVNEGQFTHTFKNNLNFEDNINSIDDFSEKNQIKLTDHEQTEVLNFLEKVTQLCSDEIKRKMEEAKIDSNTNPLLYSIPILNIKLINLSIF